MDDEPLARLRRLASIVEHAEDAIVTVDEDGRVLDWNDGAAKLFGYAADEMLGERLDRLVPSDRQDEWKTNLKHLQAGGRIRRFDTVRVRKDGGVVHVSFSLAPLYDDDGEVCGMAAIARDTGTIRQNELQLAYLNRFHTVVSGVAEAVAERAPGHALETEICRILVERGGLKLAWIGYVDDRTRRVVPSAHAGDDAGYLAALTVTARDDPHGMGPTGRAVREQRPIVSSDVATDPRMAPWRQACLTRGFHSVATLPLRRNAVVVGVLALYAGESHAFGGAMMRLAETVAGMQSAALDRAATQAARDAAEAKLRVAEQALALVAEHVGEPTFELDANGRFVAAHGPWQRVVGVAPAALVGRTAREVAALGTWVEHEGAAKRAAGGENVEYAWRAASGQALRAQLWPIRGARGEIATIVGVVRADS